MSNLKLLTEPTLKGYSEQQVLNHAEITLSKSNSKFRIEQGKVYISDGVSCHFLTTISSKKEAICLLFTIYQEILDRTGKSVFHHYSNKFYYNHQSQQLDNLIY